MKDDSDFDQLDQEVVKLRLKLRIKKSPKPLTFCTLCGKPTGECTCKTKAGRLPRVGAKSQEQLAQEWAENHPSTGHKSLGGVEHK